MQSRRDFIRLSTLLPLMGASSMSLTWSHSGHAAGASAVVILDLDAPQSKDWAASQEICAGKKIEFQQDVGGLWMDPLLPLIEKERPTLLGVTSAFQAYALAELASPYGYRFVPSAVTGAASNTSQPAFVLPESNEALAELDDFVLWAMSPVGRNFRV